MKRKQPQFRSDPPNSMFSTGVDILLLLFTSIPAYYALRSPGFFWSHEEAQYFWRLAEIHSNALNGDIFSRWFPHFALGLGLPVMEYFPCVFLYVSELFKLSGFGFFLSTKLAIVIFGFLGTISTYLLVIRLSNRWSALLSAALFSYSPYRFLNLYVRGDLNEFAAMNLLPLNLYLITRLLDDRELSRRYLFSALLACSLAVTTATHFPSCVIQFPVYVLYVCVMSLYTNHKLKTIGIGLATIVSGLALSASIWMNALLNLHYVQMEKMTQGFAHYADHFIEPIQWISTYWNYGASVKGIGDAISFQVGNFAVLCILLGLVAFPFFKPRLPVGAISLFSGVAFFGLWMTSSMSKPIWDFLPVLQKLQFPYRYLQIPTIFISFIAGILIGSLLLQFNRFRLPISLLFLIIIPLTTSRMYHPSQSLELLEQEITTNTVSRISNTHATGEFIPKTAEGKYPPGKQVDFKLEKIPKGGFSRSETEAKIERMIARTIRPDRWGKDTVPVGSVDVKPGLLDVTGQQIKIINPQGPLNRRTFECQAQTDVAVRYNQFFFPGWKLHIDGKPGKLSPDELTGLILLHIPIGQHTVTVFYDNLPASHSLKLLALISIAIHCIFWVKRHDQ